MPPTRSMAARGQSLLPIAAKVTKSASPCAPLHPAVLATGGMRRTSHECFAAATHSVCRRRIYDRPLLRSSARAEGAFAARSQSLSATAMNRLRSPDQLMKTLIVRNPRSSSIQLRYGSTYRVLYRTHFTYACQLFAPLQPALRSGVTGGRRCVVGTHCA